MKTIVVRISRSVALPYKIIFKYNRSELIFRPVFMFHLLGRGIKGEGLIYKGKEIGEEENKFVTQLICHLVSGSLAGAL